ncbi:MAG: tyrosine--tRNA ligase [bacterium]|nr:tyrosine--tRNA ligase [bacterium]
MERNWFSLLWDRSKKPLKSLSSEDFLALLKPKCREIVTERELKSLLDSKKKLRIKYGIDATGSDVHLGHAVPVMLLNLFQRAGHEIHFIIGDFTGKIGDPSGRSDKRKELTDSQITANMKSYSKQIEPLLDLKKADIHKNSTWLNKMPLTDFFKVLTSISFGEVAQREDFRERIASGAGVSMREANYAALMAVDSLHVKADVEVGGIDQLLNFMQARNVMSHDKSIGKPEVVLATPLIEGTSGDGRKMSKSFNNYVGIADEPDNQFGLIMSIPDYLVQQYFISFGDVSEGDLHDLGSFVKGEPLEAKKQLASLIVAIFHGEGKSKKAREGFERKFAKKEYTKDDEVIIKITSSPLGIMDALIEAHGDDLSKSKIRILIEQGAVHRIEGDSSETLGTEDTIMHDDLVRVGKKKIFRFHQK